MRRLTDEELEILSTKEFNWFIRTAYKSQYVTGLTTKEADTLFKIYNRVFSTNEKSSGCGTCRLKVCRELGRLYFEQQNNETKLKKNAKKETVRGQRGRTGRQSNRVAKDSDKPATD